MFHLFSYITCTNCSQCSNRHCRFVLFHTDTLEEETAHILVLSLKENSSLLSDISTAPRYTMERTNNNYTPPGPVPDIPHLNTPPLPFNPSHSTTPSFTNSTNTQPHQSNNGIYCARDTCKSKSGIRTKGHKECTNHLCKRCCQEAASLARNSGVIREPCHEPKHRLRAVTGSLAIHPMPEPVARRVTSPAVMAGPSMDGARAVAVGVVTPEPAAHRVISQDPPAPSTDGARAVAVGVATCYAMPLATMWQPASAGWLANHQQAAKGEDERRNIKKLALESRQTRGMQITTISWTAVSSEILRAPLN